MFKLEDYVKERYSGNNYKSNLEIYFDFKPSILTFLNDFNAFIQQLGTGKSLFDFVNNYYEKFHNYLGDFSNTIRYKSEYLPFNELLLNQQLIERFFDQQLKKKVDIRNNEPFDYYLKALSTIPGYLDHYNYIINNKALLSKFNQELQNYYNTKCKEKNKLSYLLKCRKKV